VDASTRHIQVQLADRNAHPLHAQVAQPEDAAAVRQHNDVHAITRPVVGHGVHVTPVLQRKVHATRAPIQPAVLQAHLADGGCVNDGRGFLHVVDDYLVKQRLVAVLQRLQRQPLVQVGRAALELLPHLLSLRLDVQLARRHHAADAQPVALRKRKASALQSRSVTHAREIGAQGGADA
jgi:hypothetical protein